MPRKTPSILRKKKPEGAKESPLDPMSASAWALGAIATARVVELIDLLKISIKHGSAAAALREQLGAATALTPCALVQDARTTPRRAWSYQDYLLIVQVCTALRKIVVDDVDFVPPGEFGLFDTVRENAANAVIAFSKEVEKYTKLIKRERAMERLSGEKSQRRGAR